MEPTAEDHLRADAMIGRCIWRSLANKYTTQWKFDDNPPIVVRKPSGKK